MSDPNTDLLSAFDGHSVEDVRAALKAGANPRLPIDGKLATDWLLEQYTRSDSLAECLRLILESGAVFRDPLIAPVVLDDADAVRKAVHADPALLAHRTSLQSSFTSLESVTLLHVAAEYGHLNAARTLIELGAQVNAQAGVDQFRLGGHTPLFHTVNSHANRSAPLMRLLVKSGADCELLIQGVHWGKGNTWETTFFDVTPVSYAQVGLLPQCQRTEQHIYDNIRFLLSAAGRPLAPLANVPNRYLKEGH
jgi:Ankyrin repeats (3 copies)